MKTKMKKEHVEDTSEMLCPICRTALIRGEDHCYETLDEHICRPNATRPVRATVVCPNQECQAHWGKIFWACDGEGPYGGGFDKKFLWIDYNPLPFGSYHRGIYFSCSYHYEDRRVSVGKLVVRREVTYKSDDYGNKTGKRVRYSIWWKNILWIPGYRMFLFSLRRFYRNKKLGSEHAVEEVNSLVQRSSWPRSAWWRKAVCLWIRLFHPTIYKEGAA